MFWTGLIVGGLIVGTVWYFVAHPDKAKQIENDVEKKLNK